MSVAGKPAADRQTYWCHECDMSVSLSLPLSDAPLACPHCSGDFLELMDSPLFPSAAADDGFLSDGPFLRRVIRHISSSAGEPASDSGGPLPASKASVEAMPTVGISSSFLELDPFLLCAVCKDHFVPADEAKQLPCSHLYHPACILPWLAHHNSCPVCRFRLPAEESAQLDPEEIVLSGGDGEDWFEYASTLRYIARRHNLLLSPGDVAEEVDSRAGLVVEQKGTAGSGECEEGEASSSSAFDSSR